MTIAHGASPFHILSTLFLLSQSRHGMFGASFHQKFDRNRSKQHKLCCSLVLMPEATLSNWRSCKQACSAAAAAELVCFALMFGTTCCAMLCYAVLCCAVLCFVIQTLSLDKGGLAGSVAWWSVYPLDVIKSRIQASSKADSEYKGTKRIIPFCRVLSLPDASCD